MAIGTGGLTGQGLFQDESIFIPNAWNDFIYSYLANALGFLGALAVLALLFAIMLRTLHTAAASADLLGRLLATGVFAALFWQCVINIGMNLQVLPVIGVTLPFFSAGGSSVLMVYLASAWCSASASMPAAPRPSPARQNKTGQESSRCRMTRQRLLHAKKFGALCNERGIKRHS